jgi:hypothetical protein
MAKLGLEIGVDSAKANSGLEAFKEKVKIVSEEGAKGMGEFGKSFLKMGPMIAVALAALAGFKEAVSAAFENAEKIRVMSEKFGIATDKVQGLMNAARNFEVSTDSLDTALNKIQVSVLEASEGSKQLVDTFKDLGINVDDLKGKSPDQMLMALADACKNAKDPTKKYAEVVQLIGRGGGDMIPMLDKGSEAIKKMGNSSAKMSESTINTLTNLQIEWGNFWQSVVSYAGWTFAMLSVLFQGGYYSVKLFVTETETAFKYLGLAIWDSLHGNFRKAVQDIKEGNAELVKNLQHTGDKINSLWNPTHSDDGKTPPVSDDSSSSNESVKAAEDVQKKIQELYDQTAKKIQSAAFDQMDYDEKILDLNKRITDEKLRGSGALGPVTPLMKAQSDSSVTDMELDKSKLVTDYNKKTLQLMNEIHQTEDEGDGSDKARLNYLNQRNASLQLALGANIDINTKLVVSLEYEKNIAEIKKLQLALTKKETEEKKRQSEEHAKWAKEHQPLIGTLAGLHKHKSGTDELGAYNNYFTANENKGHNGLVGMNPVKSNTAQTQTDKTLTDIKMTLNDTLTQIKQINQGGMGSGDGAFSV